MDNSVQDATVQTFMTPVEDLVTVNPETGIGHCMDLMRQNGIRHLPVVAAVDANVEETASMTKGLFASIDIARRRLKKKETTMDKMSDVLKDSFGDDVGGKIIHKIKKHGLLPDEDRRAIKNLSAALSRVREAKIEVQTAQDQLEMFLDHSNNGDTNGTMDDGGIKCHQIVGLISIKDMLMEITTQQVLPALEWLNEQRMEDIANRGGYSE
jgi:CBS domain-containing protein